MNLDLKNLDIRWKQRLDNYSKAFAQLSKFIAKGDLNELEQQGLIQSFKYTYELAWNVLKDLFASQGQTEIIGSRDAFRMAFKYDLIEDGEIWIEMIKSRILTSHTYNQDTAQYIADRVINIYYTEFKKLYDRLQKIAERTT